MKSRDLLQTLVMKKTFFILLHDKYVRIVGAKCGIVDLGMGMDRGNMSRSLNRAEGNSEPKDKWDSSPQTLVRESEPKVSKVPS